MIRNKTHSGFTLIELLVAMVILSLIAVAGYRGLNAVLQTRERVAEETRKWQHLAFFFSRLELDIAQAIHRPVRDGAGNPLPEWFGNPKVVAENDAELTITRAGIVDQGTEMLAPQRISYRLENNAIVLLRWPSLDQAPLTKPIRYPLLEGVSDFKLRYLDGSQNWQTQWPISGMPMTQPSAVEVVVTLVTGEKLTRDFVLQ
jgi:general secretion pathway protein J